MARPRTASNVLELRGAFKNHPGRGKDRASEPKADEPIGAAPDHLSDEAKACWDEIVGLCHRGTLCRADRLAMEYAASLLSQMRAGAWLCHPAVLIRFEVMLGKFGLTPADRSKVSATPAAPSNPFESL